VTTDQTAVFVKLLNNSQSLTSVSDYKNKAVQLLPCDAMLAQYTVCCHRVSVCSSVICHVPVLCQNG